MSKYQLPPIEDQNRTLDQLKRNLRNVIDTGKMLSDAIKKKEAEIEARYKVK
jgi:UDP-N-acetylglucosamine 2-epimerase